ncbi:hypothetical protein N0V90_002049 [Kalmusia sp. IMI 367209]|nr:hypothetical protein N0V90_002049 [Kalmusia sp. IMI 367209]
MSLATINYPTRPDLFDDEIVAWRLALEDVDGLALDFYVEEVGAHLAFINDVKLAHRIANAVETDAFAIAEAASEEVQAREDHEAAVHISIRDPEIESLPESAPASIIQSDQSEQEVIRHFAAMNFDDGETYSNDESEAGPSVPYALRQARALDELSQKRHECVACGDRFRKTSTTKLNCGDQYCNGCLKRVIMAPVTQSNLNLLPPRCHQQPIPDSVLTAILSVEELERLRSAEVEKVTPEKTYCAAVDCGRFIDPNLINDTKATCPLCGAETCARCKALFHESECTPDQELQTTLQLGGEKDWQQCYSCHRVVEKMGFGCNHITLVSPKILRAFHNIPLGAIAERSFVMCAVPSGSHASALANYSVPTISICKPRKWFIERHLQVYDRKSMASAYVIGKTDF